MKYEYDVNIIREYSLSNFYVSLSQMINIIINNNKGASIISTNFMIYKNNDNIAFSALFPYLNKNIQKKYLDKIYKSENIELFAKTIKYAGKDLILMYTDKALKDDKPDFISIMLNCSKEKD